MGPYSAAHPQYLFQPEYPPWAPRLEPFSRTAILFILGLCQHQFTTEKLVNIFDTCICIYNFTTLPRFSYMLQHSVQLQQHLCVISVKFVYATTVWYTNFLMLSRLYVDSLCK